MLCLQIDYISRLMWQAQLRGHKTWRLVPPPDCDHICTGLSFRVEPGDIGKLLLITEVMTFHIFILGDSSSCSMYINNE
jgi:hypothetical protein